MSVSRCVSRLHLLRRSSSIATEIPHALQSSSLRCCCRLQPAAPTSFLTFRRTASYQAASNSAVTPAVKSSSPQSSSAATSAQPITEPASTPAYQDLTAGLNDFPVTFDESGNQIDWARSFHGLSTQPFSKEAADVLLQPIPVEDIEIKPDGIVFLPEIKYRRILNKAFGPGGWGLAPRSETIITEKHVTREYALVAHGRLVSVARGEMEFFSPEGIPTATEGVKSNAMMRCCKDLGVASELWDPRFIQKYMAEHGKEIFVEHVVTKKRRKIWLRKDSTPRYPYKETKGFVVSSTVV